MQTNEKGERIHFIYESNSFSLFMSRHCQSKIARYLRIYAVETVECDIELCTSCESQVATSNNIINRNVYIFIGFFFCRRFFLSSYSLVEWTENHKSEIHPNPKPHTHTHSIFTYMRWRINCSTYFRCWCTFCMYINEIT